MKNLVFYIALFVVSITSAQTEKNISGVVLDVYDEPISGASVYGTSNIIGNKTKNEGVIQGTMIGTTTGLDGKFSFNASENIKSISVSFLGFGTKTVNVSLKKEGLRIMLEESSEMLDKIVITGYQKIEKRKVASAIQKVKAKELKQIAVPNVDQMLTGQISGVNITSSNGAPGAVAQIQIRGITSLKGSSDPLWVVDGIPLEGGLVPNHFDKDNIDDLTSSYPIAGINPNDIEEITVLKDASATSIYGARASNGVIVITTKKGKEGNMQLNFSASTSVGFKPDIRKLNLMNASEKVDFELLLASRKDLTFRSERGEVARILNKYNEYSNFQDNGINVITGQAKNEINTLRGRNTQWEDYLYQNTVNSNYNFSASGGSKKSNYYLSLGYFDQEGTTKGTGFKRYNLTLKNEFKITDKLTATTSIFTNRNRNNSYIVGADAYTNPAVYIRRVNPYQQVTDTDGSYIYDADLIDRDFKFNYNILEEQNNTSSESISNSIKPMLNLGYKFNRSINVSSQLGLQYDFDDTENIANESSYYTRKFRFKSRYLDANNKGAFFMPEGGVIRNWSNKTYQYTWKNLINYNKRFNSVHEIDVMLGNELRRNKKTSIVTKGFGFNETTLQSTPITNDRALSNKIWNPYKKAFEENAFVSVFGTASYTYNRKYTVFGSLRYDGSNLFGVNAKYRYLPIWSVAGTWDVTRENFMENIDFISDLRLRASYGIQGSIDKSTSAFTVGVYKDVTILPNTTEELIQAEQAPNANLRWEKTSSSNIGFDLGLLKNRISITADYYQRTSTDLIGLKSTPLENGFGFVNSNWASISNKGYEIGLSTKNINRKDFKWITNFNFSHNENKVDRIQIKDVEFKPSKEGYGVYAIFGIKTAGIDSSGLPIFIRDGKTMSAVDFYNLNGDLSYEDHRNLYSYIGDATPKFTGGFTNTFKYKQFSLRVATNFSLLRTVQEKPHYDPTYIEPGYNYNREVLKAGTGNYPALIGYNSPGFETKSVYSWYHSKDDGLTYKDLDIWLKEMSHIRVNNIRFGYDFKPEVIKKIGLKRFNMSLEGRNLFVFGTDYTGYFDPEGYGATYRQPIQKSISFGFNMSF